MSELQTKIEEIKRQKDTYIIPENLKKDVTVYGITGTYEGSGGSGDVKLFDTVEHMQQDPSPSEGDLAIVYREEIQPINEDSEFDSCIFPNTVVLDEAFSGSVQGRFRSAGGGFFDGMTELSSSSFVFDGWGDTMVRVQYTSNDGITYTRTDGGEELQEFGTTLKYESWGDPFPAVIGNFMKTGENYFEGLYGYTLDNVDLSKFWLLNLEDVDIEEEGDPTFSYNNKFEYNSQELVDIIAGFAEISSMYIIEGRNNMDIGIYRGIDGNVYSIIPSANVEPSRYSVGFYTYIDGTVGFQTDVGVPFLYEYFKYDVITQQYSKIGDISLNDDTVEYNTAFYPYAYTKGVFKVTSNILVKPVSPVINCRGDGYYGRQSLYVHI